MLGKAATWLLYLGVGCSMVTRPSTAWPLWIFWAGFALAIASLMLYARQGAERDPRDESRRHGRRRGDSPAPAHLEPAEADGADRRQAVHGAHPRAAARARLRGGRRHGRVPAAGDPLVLRRRREPRPRHLVLGRGEPARHRRLGAARERRARRDVPRHLGRRALRHRPRQDRRVPQGEGRGRHDRHEVGREPARVRDRRHRRGRARRALPREAVVGAGVLGHDQHRHLRARAGGAASTSRPTGRTTSRRSSSRCCSRWGGRSTATSATATGRTSATSTSTGRRTSTRSTRRCG